MKNWIKTILREEAGDGGEGGGGAAGGEETPWFQDAGFSEEVLADESVQGVLGKYKNPDDFAKGAANLSAKIGEKGLIMPGEKATDDERAEFYNKLGRPEAPDKYSWEPPEGMGLDEAVYSEKTQALHEAGLTDEQHKAVMDLYAGEVQRMNEQLQAQQAEIASESEKALKEEWGDEYDENIKGARAVAKKFGVVDALKKAGTINDAGILKMLSEVAKSTRQDGIQQSSGFSSAKEELESIKQNPAYLDKTHADHRKLLERAVELRGSL